MTLLQFKAAADALGSEPAGSALEKIDPVVGEFCAAVERLSQDGFFRKSIEELLAEGQVGK
jgi:hypothetical protein